MASDEHEITGSEHMGVKDPTGLIALVLTQLDRVKVDIVRVIDDNSREGARRWEAHEHEHSAILSRIAQVAERLDAHLEAELKVEREERERELRHDAWTRPLYRAGTWAKKEWRWLLIASGFLVPQLADLARALGIAP